MGKASEKVALNCLRMILKPVARFCLKHSLTVREVLEGSKAALIEAATEEMERSGQKINISRLSVITGIHRRDVMRLTREGASLEQPANLISRIIGQWEQDPRYQTAAGKPRVLTVEGEESEFRKLVQLISQDLNPGTVLFQLERTGSVERTKGGLRLKRRAHSLQHDIEEGYRLLSSDADDLMLAVLENLEGELEQPHLHARTEYDNIYEEKLPEIRQWLLDQGSEFHERLRGYLAQFDKDVNPAPGTKAGSRVVVGTFSRVEFSQKEEEE